MKEASMRKLMKGIFILQIVWSGPRLTPQEAADILRPHGIYQCRDDCNGPYVAIAPTLHGDAALGPWKFPRMPPPRRLDGTLLSQPAQTYGGLDYFVPWGPASPSGQVHQRRRRETMPRRP